MADDGCRLLSLPPEIRNAIYELVLTIDQDEFGTVDIGKRPKAGNNAVTYTAQALLQTCKEVYADTASVFYSVNIVSLPNLRVKSFLDAMSPQRLSFITHFSAYGKNKADQVTLYE